MRIPPYLQAGDSALWLDDSQTINGITYTPAGYGLTYAIRGPSALDLTATVTGQQWQTTITTIQSAALTPGPYRWAAYLTATDTRITAGQGDLTVGVNLQTLAAGVSALSFYEQALSDIETALAAYGKSGGQPLEWQIGQNRYKFNTLADIQSLANYFKAAVMREQAAGAISQGQGNPRKMYVRFIG